MFHKDSPEYMIGMISERAIGLTSESVIVMPRNIHCANRHNKSGKKAISARICGKYYSLGSSSRCQTSEGFEKLMHQRKLRF